jgi:hypothetical protein
MTGWLGTGAGSRELVTGWETTQEWGLGSGVLGGDGLDQRVGKSGDLGQDI